MELEIAPAPSDDERAALALALEPADLPALYESPWRQTALREAADVTEP